MSSTSGLITISCKDSGPHCIIVSWHTPLPLEEVIVVVLHNGHVVSRKVVPPNSHEETVCGLHLNTEYEVYLTDQHGKRISNECRAFTSPHPPADVP